MIASWLDVPTIAGVCMHNVLKNYTTLQKQSKWHIPGRSDASSHGNRSNGVKHVALGHQWRNACCTGLDMARAWCCIATIAR
jgi:hypothetical protein